MPPGRFKALSRLFEAALAKPTPQRAAYLAQACGGDEALRAEIESLIAAHESPDGFLERPPPGLDEEMTPTTPLPAGDAAGLDPGARLGPYEIVSLLGAGGMGEVYRARDPRIDREVAVKILSRARGESPELLARFRDEARAAGALDHPNILVVHDVDEDEGTHYVVTELLEGETLRERLRSGALAVATAIDVARQIAAGLAAAHEKGITHRDLKPENLFLTSAGRVKILDFGLAKRTGLETARTAADGRPARAALTRPGLPMGTVGYMAPEQARGEPADARSDLFAFGVVLYEMLAGHRAFSGDSDVAVLSAILRDAPPALRGLRREVPEALERIVLRCLQKQPARRFATATDCLAALDALRGPGSVARSGGARSVAILPFRYLGADPDAGHLGVALADATITELGRNRRILVRPTSAILPYRDRRPDPVEAARELGVEAVVDASFQRAGKRLRVTAQLVSADGSALWTGRVDTAIEDILRIQDEVARSITRALAVELPAAGAGGRARRSAKRRPGPRARAYDYYLRGRACFVNETLEDFVAAADWFEKARETDPRLAIAWAGLAEAYARLCFNYQPHGNWYPRARAMCARALALDPRLPEAYCARARLRWSPRGGWDNAGGLRDLMRAIAGRPGLETAHLNAGVLLFHVGLIDEGLVHISRALEINPQHQAVRYQRAFCLYHLGEGYEEIRRISREVAERAPARWIFYQWALCEIRLGRLDAAEEIAGRLRHAHAIRALVAALRGDRQRAVEEIRLTEKTRQDFGDYHHNQYEVACAYARLGESRRAVDWLAAAAANGYPCVTLFERDPYLEPLRGDARFERLLTRLRAGREGYRRLYRRVQAPASTP